MSTATAPSSSAPRTSTPRPSTPPPSAPRTSTPSGSAPSSGPSGGAATPATGGAQAAAPVTPVRDSAEISPTARAEAGAIDPDSPADLTDQIGSLDYYRMRADDFRERNPDMEPPDYYMNYGDKYARRFTEELSPNLSERGQQWLVDARANLQEAMEARRAEDPAAFAELERDPEAFRRFAYDTHPTAYRDAGLAELRPSDLVQIPLTPDRQDLVSGPGLRQVVDTGVGVVGDWAGMGADAIADSGVGRAVADGANYVANSPVGQAVSDGAQWVADSPVGQAVGDAGEAIADGAQWVAESPVGQAVGQGVNTALDYGFEGVAYGANAAIDGFQYAADTGVGRAIGDGAEWVADSAVGRTVGGWGQSAWDGLNSLWD